MSKLDSALRLICLKAHSAIDTGANFSTKEKLTALSEIIEIANRQLGMNAIKAKKEHPRRHQDRVP